MTLFNLSDWLLLAVTALLAAVGFLYRLRLRLHRRNATPARPDAWMRGRLPLVGLTLATLFLGFALGAGYGRWSFISLQLQRWEESGPQMRFIPGLADFNPPEAAGEADPDSGSAPAAELSWAVRVGVFSERARADRLSASLSGLGLGLEPLVIQRQTQDGDPRYWVYAGRYPTRAEASAAAADLRARGRDALAVRMGDDGPGG